MNIADQAAQSAEKEIKRQQESFRIAIISKDLASKFWRKNNPIKKKEK